MKKSLAIIVIALAIMSFSACGSSDDAAKANTSASPSATAKSDITNTISKDTVIDALKAKDGTLAKQITDVTSDGSTVTVAIYFENLWDDKSFITNNQHYSAEVFQNVFLNSDVQTVIYQADVPVNDAYGNTSKKTGQTNTMTRTDADKVADWDKFAWETPSQYYSVVQFQLANESEISGLHKAWYEYYGE